MAYNQNIPAAGDRLSQSQSQIQQNFAALFSFGNGYVSMPAQVSAPSFSAGIDGIYTLAYASTSQNECFVHQQRTAPADAPADIPFTASKMSNAAMASCDNGWSYLPSGLLIKWGLNAATTSPVSITPTVTSSGPNFNRVFQVYVTPLDTGTATNFTCGQRTDADNTSGNFTAYCANPSVTTSIVWLVVGV